LCVSFGGAAPLESAIANTGDEVAVSTQAAGVVGIDAAKVGEQRPSLRLTSVETIRSLRGGEESIERNNGTDGGKIGSHLELILTSD
jgi:hypothetical protein